MQMEYEWQKNEKRKKTEFAEKQNLLQNVKSVVHIIKCVRLCMLFEMNTKLCNKYKRTKLCPNVTRHQMFSSNFSFHNAMTNSSSINGIVGIYFPSKNPNTTHRCCYVLSISFYLSVRVHLGCLVSLHKLD